MAAALALALALVVACVGYREGPAGRERISVPLPGVSSGSGRGDTGPAGHRPELERDPKTGLCELTEEPGVYLEAGWFLRRDDNGWLRSRWSSGPWGAVPEGWRPPGPGSGAEPCSPGGDAGP